MSWPVPDIKKKQSLPRPDFKKWGRGFLMMLVAGIALNLFIGRETRYEHVFLYGALPAFFLWLCLFGSAWHRYEQSINNALLWNNETERTKSHWKRWCMKQWLIVGNIVMAPEEQGVKVLLGNYADIPAFPKKARPLSYAISDLPNRLKYVDEQLEKQCSGYRNSLYSVKVLITDRRREEQISLAVNDQWDLYPEYVDSFEEIQSAVQQNGIVLLLCLQDWQEGEAEKFSEFISGQLIAPPSLVEQCKLTVLAGLGRVLSSNDVMKELDILFEYNSVDYNDLFHVWLAGIDGKNRTKIAQYADAQQWKLPPKQPCYSLDHTFGPNGPLSFPVYIALMVDAAVHTGEMQLLIFQQKEGVYSLCLITRELF
ncbi:hypothetical protein [Pantoea stewartii]|uniref:hypothetical protein n=2 Tax=Pantoea stewartii TaxID=66269 RepID=UPI000543E4E4|nr:hypothetical protein [Pantoea stewartii]KHE01700.1 hypothetical protein NL54_10535 [Pantoea stewartii]KHN62790.1 hypothetical protein OI73_10075 [Pantoea stewartii]